MIHQHEGIDVDTSTCIGKLIDKYKAARSFNSYFKVVPQNAKLKISNTNIHFFSLFSVYILFNGPFDSCEPVIISGPS